MFTWGLDKKNKYANILILEYSYITNNEYKEVSYEHSRIKRCKF